MEQFLYGLPTPGWLEELHTRGVETVMPLGETALRRVTGETDIKRWRGRVVPCASGLWAIPSWKASRLLPRKQIPGQFDPDIQKNASSFTGQLLRDFHQALKVAREGFTRRSVAYLEDPSPDVFQQWYAEFCAAYNKGEAEYLSFDIETPYKLKESQEDDMEESEASSELNLQILRVSFAWKEYEAVTVPHVGPYIPAIGALLAHQVAKVGHNSGTFDIPVLEANGHTVNGVHHDAMDTYKVLQSDLPRGLEAVSADHTDVLPWKHLSDANPTWYSAADADVCLRNFLDMKRQLIKRGSWDAYMLDVVALMPILYEAGRRGNQLDLVKQAELRERFGKEMADILTEIQDVVPVELCPRKRYKKQPFPATIAVNSGIAFHEGRRFESVLVPDKVKVCARCGTQGVTKGDHTAKKSLGKVLKAERHHPKKCLFELPGQGCSCPKGWPKKEWEVTPNSCHGAEIKVEVHPVAQWDEVLPFNPGSSQQLIGYMKHYKHPVGTNKDDHDKEAADKKHMTMLAKKFGAKHQLYPLALMYSKVKTAIVRYLPDATPEGRIFTLFGNGPSTLRLGARKVKNGTQIQNWGKREENPYTAEARQQIIASPGHKLVEGDSTSIEAITLGFLMGDENYIALANLSVHAYLCCMALGWEFTPENVERVKKEQKPLYARMKTCSHLTGFGGSAYALFQTYPEFFPTLKDAERTQNTLFRKLPKLEAFHFHTRHSAQKQCYLQSPFMHRHHFYDVYSYKKDRFGNQEYTESGRPKLKTNKDGKRCVAYLPQHTAGIFMRRNLVKVGQSKWRQYMGANVSVHDSICLDVPEALVSDAVEFLADLLTRPIVEMGGLKIGCEIGVGDNWADAHVHTDKCRADGCKAIENPNGMRTVKKIVIDNQQLSWLPTIGQEKVAA